MRAGIDLGGTKIQAVVLDDDHRVLGQARCPTPTTGGPQDVADAMAGATLAALGDAGLDPDALHGIGVGSPGIIDVRRGIVTSARNLPNWEESFALGGALKTALGA